MRRLSRHTPRKPMAAVAALTMVGSGVTWVRHDRLGERHFE